MYARVNKLVLSFWFRAISLIDIRCYVSFHLIVFFFFFIYFVSYVFLFILPSTHWNVYKTLVTADFHLSICFLVLSLAVFNKLPEPRWMVSEIRLFLYKHRLQGASSLEHKVSKKKRFVLSFFFLFKFTSRKIYIRVCIIYNSHRPMSRTSSVSMGKKTWSWLPEIISV